MTVSNLFHHCPFDHVPLLRFKFDVMSQQPAVSQSTPATIPDHATYPHSFIPSEPATSRRTGPPNPAEQKSVEEAGIRADLDALEIAHK